MLVGHPRAAVRLRGLDQSHTLVPCDEMLVHDSAHRSHQLDQGGCVPDDGTVDVPVKPLAVELHQSGPQDDSELR